MSEPLDLEPIKARLAHREVSSELVLRRDESVGDDGVRRGVSSLEPVNAREHREYVAHRDDDLAALVAEVERLRAEREFLASWAGPSLDERTWLTEDRDRLDGIWMELEGEPYGWNTPTERP